MTQYAKAPIEPAQFARNGKYPDGFFWGEIGDQAIRCAQFRLKQLGAWSCGSQNVPSPYGGDGEQKRFRFRFVASPYAAAIVFKAWMAPDIPESTSSRPRAECLIENDAGTDQGTATIQFGASSVSTTDPNDLGLGQTFVIETGGTDIWAPTANTIYQGTISDYDTGRVMSCCVYEVSLNTAAPYSTGHALGTPILDIYRQQITAGLRQMWKTQAAPLFHWSITSGPTARTRTSTTNINVIDNASTTASAATAHYLLDNRNRSTLRRVTVPVTIYAYGSSAGTGGVVQIRDNSNSVIASITGITTEGWYSTTADLPATRAGYQVFYSGDGTNVFSLYAVSMYPYTTGS